MKDWKTHDHALLPGARSAKVGTPSGITLATNAKSGTKLAGNCAGGMPALAANVCPSPKLTK